ncbi:MAG: methylated-DNA--[protein]-cysteine S-methyltransferase [Burkholderiales bacterium]|nr:MAG: methylated-DNA--[protein]-cysteine S-methyltransferase [Burkholderiales bacterium]
MRVPSPLGPMLAVSDGSALTGLYFEGQRHGPTIGPDWRDAPALEIFATLRSELEQYFAGATARFSIRLSLRGTAFQRAVWDALLSIGPGSTCSYAELARAIGRPRAVRAVGAAVGRNPVSVIVPCHRVVGSDGALTGYAGGLRRKRALLALECPPAAAAAAAAEPALLTEEAR